MCVLQTGEKRGSGRCVKGYAEAVVSSLFAEAGDRPRRVKEALLNFMHLMVHWRFFASFCVLIPIMVLEIKGKNWLFHRFKVDDLMEN